MHIFQDDILKTMIKSVSLNYHRRVASLLAGSCEEASGQPDALYVMQSLPHNPRWLSDLLAVQSYIGGIEGYLYAALVHPRG